MSRHDSRKQRGFSLLDVLIALLIFSMGMLGLSSLYVRAAAQPMENGHVVTSQLAAQALLATLRVNPSVLPLQLSAANSASSLPAGALASWFAQYSQLLPGLQVSLVSQSDATGAACSSGSCGVQLTLSWLQAGSRRTQTFHGQIGLR